MKRTFRRTRRSVDKIYSFGIYGRVNTTGKGNFFEGNGINREHARSKLSKNISRRQSKNSMIRII